MGRKGGRREWDPTEYSTSWPGWLNEASALRMMRWLGLPLQGVLQRVLAQLPMQVKYLLCATASPPSLRRASENDVNGMEVAVFRRAS